MKIITYGLGGADKSKPNNNIVEELELSDFPNSTTLEGGE
jgi:hypothetical protein